MPAPPGFAGPVACLESAAFRDWIRGFMTTLLTDYELDGVIWDEPKAVSLVSRHPETLARFGPSPTEEDMQNGFVDFLQMLTTRCLDVRPDLSVTLFSQKTDPEPFTRKAAGIRGLQFAGYDGNLARQSSFHETPQWRKYLVR